MAPLGKVLACTGAHFRDLLILLSPEGKGFLTENPVFRKDFRKREGIWKGVGEGARTTRHHTPTVPCGTVADLILVFSLQSGG